MRIARVERKSMLESERGNPEVVLRNGGPAFPQTGKNVGIVKRSGGVHGEHPSRTKIHSANCTYPARPRRLARSRSTVLYPDRLSFPHLWLDPSLDGERLVKPGIPDQGAGEKIKIAMATCLVRQALLHRFARHRIHAHPIARCLLAERGVQPSRKFANRHLPRTCPHACTLENECRHVKLTSPQQTTARAISWPALPGKANLLAPLPRRC